MRKGLFWLNDEQWAQIKPHRPTNQTGSVRDDDRRITSGIIRMLQCSAGAIVLGPFEGLRVSVVQVDEAADVGLELLAGVNTSLDLLSGEFGEPTLDLIDP